MRLLEQRGQGEEAQKIALSVFGPTLDVATYNPAVTPRELNNVCKFSCRLLRVGQVCAGSRRYPRNAVGTATALEVYHPCVRHSLGASQHGRRRGFDDQVGDPGEGTRGALRDPRDLQ